MTKIVIIEDEKPAYRLLKGMISQLRADWELIAHHDSIADAVTWFQNHTHPDIVFMDIRLADGLSFTILDKVQIESFIIFTTAYDEYAIQAFQVNSIDYLLKPFDEEALEKAILKYEGLTVGLKQQKMESINVDELIDSIRAKQKTYRTRFLIAYRNNLHTLSVKDIAFFYCENRITHVITYSGKEHVVEYSLDKLSEQLDPDQFFRTSRNTLVHVNSVKQLSPYFAGKILVTLDPPSKEKLTVSKAKAPLFKKWLNY